MEFSFFSKKALFYNFHILLIIFFSLFFQLFCKPNENPKEIIQNYFQINLLSSGQSFTFNNNKIFIICSYDSEFSNKIKIINNRTQKNILCLTHSRFDSYLYIANNSDEYLYKFELNLDENIEILNLNIFPFVDKNNKLSFITTFFDLKNNLGFIDKYIINNLEIKKEKTFLLNYQNLDIYNGYLNSKISNKCVTCCIIIKNSIYSYMYTDETNNVLLNNITCQNCLDFIKDEITYSYIINKEQNIIFICYKFNGTKVNCYFYNMENNSFIYNYNELECENNMNNYYFIETKEYALVCQNSNVFNIYILDEQNLNQNFTYSTIYFYENQPSLAHNLFLYYNSSNKEYNLIDSIYDNYTNEYFKTNYSINTNHFNNMPIQKRKLDSYTNINEILKDIPKYIEQNFKNPLIYKIIDDKYHIIIKNSSSSNAGVTDLDFDNCESYLQFYYNYTSFIHFILEIADNVEESINNKVEYKLFDENKSEVNLSICKDFYGRVKYSIRKDIDIDIDEIMEYMNAKANLFNKTDEFFTELCKVYHELDYDVILEDRIKDLYKNYYVCQEGCYFEKIDKSYVYCQCKIKQNISLEKRQIELGEIPAYYPKAIEVFKCFGLVFASDDKINNIGFYLFTFMLGTHIPIWCYYISTGVKPTKDYIIGEMTKFGYIKNKKKSKVIKVRKGGYMRKSTKIKKKKKVSDNNIGHINKKDNKNKITSSPPPKKPNENEEKNENGNEKKFTKRNLKRNKSLTVGTTFVIKNNDRKQKKRKSKHSQQTIDSDKSENSKNIIKNYSSSNNVPNNLMETQIKDDDFYYGGESKPKNYDDFNFITIDLENKSNNENRKESKKILNNYTYEEAIELDKRSFCQILYIFMLSKDIVFHTILLDSPFDSLSVLASMLIFTIANDLFFNCILYTNENISKRFKTRESIFPFTFKYNMGYIFGSIIIVYVVIFSICSLINFSPKIIDVFKKEEKKLKNDKNYEVNDERKSEIEQEIKKMLEKQNKKNIAFFAIEILFMLIYWYYVTAFCHVFTNTQTTLILDTFFSIVFRFIINCLLCLILSILYKYSIRHKSEKLYEIIIFIYLH